jgi:hypothetical protein
MRPTHGVRCIKSWQAVAIGMDLSIAELLNFAAGGVFWNGQATKRPVAEPRSQGEAFPFDQNR